MVEADYAKLTVEELREHEKIIARVIDQKITASGVWRGGQRECQSLHDDGHCGCEGVECYMRDGGYGR